MSVTIPRWLAQACALATFLALATPARAGFGVGPSSPIDPVRFPAVGTQVEVAAADNGTLSLFVWRDTRHGNGDLWAARVDHAGNVLDPNGIELAATPADEAQPALAWNGAQWLVAWTEIDPLTSHGTVRAARVGVDGQLADPAPLTLSTGGDARHPGVAWNGALWIAVWQEASGGSSQLLGATVDAGGNLLAGPGPLTAGSQESEPAVAALGANALVTFTSARTGPALVYAVRVTAALPGGAIVRLDASDLRLTSDNTGQGESAVAASGSAWLVAWRDDRSSITAGSDVLAARVSAAGALLDAVPAPVGTALGADHAPALTWDGSQWLATWTGAAGQFARAVSANGNALPGTVLLSGPGPLPGLGAWGGDAAHAIVAWSEPDGAGDPANLVARRIGTGLTFGPPFAVATQTPNQTDPSLAFGAGRWMMAWVDDRFGAGARQVRVGLTDSARFEAPDPATVAFAVPRPGLDQGHPALVYDGTNFNLFWDESRGGHLAVMGARFTAGGAFIDTFTVSGGAWNQYEPTAVAFGDGDVSVAWTDSRVGPTERDIWIAGYANGAVKYAPRALANVPGVREEHPSAADLGGFATMVVYETSAGGLDRAIESAQIGRDITLGAPYHQVAAGAAGHTYQHPIVSGNGQDLMLAYEEVVFSDGPALHKPFLLRYDALFASWYCCPNPPDPGSYTPANPVVGSAGYDYVALWSTLNGGGPDVLAAAVDPYENVVAPGALRLTSDPVVDTPGAVAQGQGDRLGVTFVRALDSASWSGLQLMGGDARDTLSGQVVINEFMAHPASDRHEYFELFDTGGRSFFLNGWHLLVNGQASEVTGCGNIIGARKGSGPVTQGQPCGTIDPQFFFTDSTFTGRVPDPVEGFLPDRQAVLQLVSPGGVVVDQVGYGTRGGAPVSAAIPRSIAPVSVFAPVQGRTTGDAATEGALATGDSLSISTSRIPNGTNTGNNATDFNLTANSTANSTNTGTTAQLGTALFITRAYWYPLATDAVVELYNPSTTQSFDFSGWYLSNNNVTQQIGIAGNAWSVLQPQDKRILRSGDLGSFNFKMDELSVLYLLGPDFTRFEQLGWSRPDDISPDMCVTRVPDTGGFHDGFDWFTCGGQQDITSGEIRYTTCTIQAPPTDVPPLPAIRPFTFAGAWPNPAHAGQAATLVFTLPGRTGGLAVHAVLALYDVAGRRVATLLDAALPPGEQRVPLTGTNLRGPRLRAGTYYAELSAGGDRLRRTIVLLP